MNQRTLNGLDSFEVHSDNLTVEDDALSQSHIQGLETALSTLTTAVSTETTNRTTADTTLQNQITTNANNISTESTSRSSADTNLQSQITTNANNISTESTNRANSDTNILNGTSPFTVRVLTHAADVAKDFDASLGFPRLSNKAAARSILMGLRFYPSAHPSALSD